MATDEQIETIQKFCSFMRSDPGASMVAQRITTSMKDLEHVADYLSGNGMYDPIFSQTLAQAIGFTSGPADSEDLQEWLKLGSLPELMRTSIRKGKVPAAAF